MKIKLIFFLIYLSLINAFDLTGQSVKTDFEIFIEGKVSEAISNGQIDKNPLIIIQGFPLTNPKDKTLVYHTMVIQDVKELSVLDSKTASEIFDNEAKNGVLLIVLKRSGKKKLKSLGYL